MFKASGKSYQVSGAVPSIQLRGLTRRGAKKTHQVQETSCGKTARDVLMSRNRWIPVAAGGYHFFCNDGWGVATDGITGRALIAGENRLRSTVTRMSRILGLSGRGPWVGAPFPGIGC